MIPLNVIVKDKYSLAAPSYNWCFLSPSCLYWNVNHTFFTPPGKLKSSLAISHSFNISSLKSSFFLPFIFTMKKKKNKTLLCQCKVFKINHSLTKSSYILKQIYVKEGSDIYSFFHLYGRVNLLAAGAQVGNKLPMMKKLQIITLSWTQCSGNPISYPCCSSVPATWEESWRILKWE